MDASKYRSRGHTMANNKKLPPYLLLVLLAIGAAAVSVGILHKMRERRVLTVLLQERDQQLMSFQVLFEKEKEINKEMRRKVDELEAKTSALSIERAELKNKLMDSETTTTYLTNTQKELEAALVEKESHINQMKENVAASNPDQATTGKEFLQEKEAELDKSANSSDSIPVTAEDNSNSTTTSESNHQEENNVVGANNENATSELEKPENSGDSMAAPAEEENSSITNASERSHQDESILVGVNNENTSSDAVVPDKTENTNDSVPTTAEEQNSYNTTATESNEQDNSSSQEQFVKLTTNMEDGQPQETKSDANEQPDDAPEGSHSDKSELPQWSQKQEDSQEASKEEPDGTKQVENPQGEVSNHSRDSKLLENQDGSVIIEEAAKEINPEGTSSKESLTEANQNKTQAVEPAANPADANPSMPTNNEEIKETSKRHRRRRSRSRRKRRATVAANNNDGNHQMEVDTTA
ncbi:hypothetical protein HU200_057711 [Digitaria exilis]|uniref:Uncharacterized protein n=1 Tax=Digitaria exilis TaxID=1010633 RepID=A0A835AGC3_9POAL|nr:hypothetical protein HU200_057711 [Digitaria exilis]CAB3485890.1 unnamed protein product [Digitaria exilis]